MIRIIESRKDFGTMNTGTVRYSNLTEEDKRFLCKKHHIDIVDLEHYDLVSDRKEIFNRHRENLGAAMGFDGRHMFMADQAHKTGSHFEITKEYVRDYPEGWTNIPEDILVVTSHTPKVVIGHPVADCPVVMMMDRKQGVSAIGHCSGEMIDKRLPEMIAEVLRKDYGSKADELIAYVSASIGPGWTYDCFPRWAKDEKIWDSCIYMGEDGLFHIDLKPAIMLQLIKSGLQREHIMFSQDDTQKNPNYYSNSMASQKENPAFEKMGRHFAGMFYTDEDGSDIEIRKGKRGLF